MSRSGTVRFHEVNEVPYGSLSVLSPHPIVVRHVGYPSAHHYYLCQKFKGTDYEPSIRQAQSLWEVDRYVRRAEGSQRPEWESIKVEVMLLANYYKFKQNADMQTLLLGTGGRVVVNHTVTDAFWGDAGDGSGKNMMGVILMAVRKRLLAEDKQRRRAEQSAQRSAAQPPPAPLATSPSAAAAPSVPVAATAAAVGAAAGPAPPSGGSSGLRKDGPDSSQESRGKRPGT
eukprot:TRINITY_DN47330_c0_g1_i1.p1 TRINITY_DN47330_c0_g1~~TRINITY_DN47330_c0_g1_i1.p1  ORF type:complete len:229 (+),score=71.06 TRINITY_DN47330_c0_g1_i1:76-762(+)